MATVFTFTLPPRKNRTTDFIALLHGSTKIEPHTGNNPHRSRQFHEFYRTVIAQRRNARCDLKLNLTAYLARQHGESCRDVAVLNRLMHVRITPDDSRPIFGKRHRLPNGNEGAGAIENTDIFASLRTARRFSTIHLDDNALSALRRTRTLNTHIVITNAPASLYTLRGLMTGMRSINAYTKGSAFDIESRHRFFDSCHTLWRNLDQQVIAGSADHTARPRQWLKRGHQILTESMLQGNDLEFRFSPGDTRNADEDESLGLNSAWYADVLLALTEQA